MQYFSDTLLKDIYDSIVQETEPDRPMHIDKIKAKKEKMIRQKNDNLSKVKRILLEQLIEKYGVMALKMGSKI